jgi:hypothetical protein
MAFGIGRCERGLADPAHTVQQRGPCLHPAEGDIQAPNGEAGFDPNPTFPLPRSETIIDEVPPARTGTAIGVVAAEMGASRIVDHVNTHMRGAGPFRPGAAPLDPQKPASLSKPTQAQRFKHRAHQAASGQLRVGAVSAVLAMLTFEVLLNHQGEYLTWLIAAPTARLS